MMIHQPQRFSDAHFAPVLARFVQQQPLVHCMTNDVVQNFTANVLLALHASPAMVIDPDEAAQFAATADALLINVGTLTCDRRDAMLAAVQAAEAAQTPWVLDPVAVGALRLRTEFSQQLLALRPAAVRGNASEILALAQQSAGGRGVDTQHQAEAALEAARSLAKRAQTLVVVSGEVDYVTDGDTTLSIPGGSALMTRVVGTGCALSAVVAAFCSLPGERLHNVASACRVMACAGERAAAQTGAPGSFATLFIDALWQLAQEARA
ncbi:hydroxyethylthiazole kinase [Pantoea piersonii]|uniref:Hydroxyethylthiazole kinase n=2 Tax=Pantoea piersonii TaxID=2364647 RepID=A0AAJ5UB04_9GAMM|nr:hydroxyethylthiazole kinase [Pantoea piersonii]WBG92078.1 hydroxyethylthiazole kinase [Pantoea piersonii]